MKKISKLLLMSVMMFSVALPVCAAQTDTTDKKLASIQGVMDKVNAELGSTYYIPEGNEEKVLKGLEKKSLEQIEEYLTEQYIEPSPQVEVQDDFVPSPIAPSFMADPDNVMTTMTITETIRQTHALQYNSMLYLNSTVFSPTGAAGTFTYQTVRTLGVVYPANFTGFHYEVDTINYQIHPTKKAVGVELTGHPEDTNGIALALVLKTQHVFNAG